MKVLRPHIYFWLTALSIMLISEVSIQNINDVVNINIHDTYYIIARREIGILLCSLYILVGCIYWVFQKRNIKLNANLTTFHTTLSMATVVIYFGFLIYYTYFKTNNVFEGSNETNINLILIFTTLIIQVHFIYNIVSSLLRHIANKKV